MKTIYRTISEQIADLIRNEIISGSIGENSLLKEQELSNRFEVSRGTIRHALMQLVAEGIVTSTPNIGMRVASQPTEESIALIVEIRTKIEDFILSRVFNQLKNENLEEWRKILQKLQDASEQNDIDTFMEADIRFHRFFIELYPDKHVTDLWEDARARMMMRYDRLKNLKSGFEEHEKIFKAVESGDLKKALASLHSNVV
ncbi:MAG: GntR family transcriptional regulator [Spirochaetales bacterium]|uniref:GntR family transcriptional regulator n=1 Tax=Candidatus Thalassospirochaeta sargassi TaxID=3119039 RepID=A0AAJ1II91_9SPIO|nr:GntR family transcriptional regulator [Spirochaetales bacterium]